MGSHVQTNQNRPQGDEWITVPRGKPRAAKSAPKAPGFDRDITLNKLIASYEHRMQIWRASTCRQQVRQIFDRKKPESGWQIKQAICFASGSFCRDNWECQRRSMAQFVAFMDIVDHLQTTSAAEICISARELVYTQLDAEFLSKLKVAASVTESIPPPSEGTSVLQDESDCDSFVFEPFMDKVLSAVQTLLTFNAKLFIGTSCPSSEASGVSGDELQKMRSLYEKFNADHSSYYFPSFEEDPNIFEGLRICWREECEDD